VGWEWAEESSVIERDGPASASSGCIVTGHPDRLIAQVLELGMFGEGDQLRQAVGDEHLAPRGAVLPLPRRRFCR